MPLEPVVQHRFVGANIIVRHAARDFIDLGKSALDGLEHLERMLVQDIERAVDALVADALGVAVADPGGEGEQHRRQHHRCHHHQLEQPYGCVARGQHVAGSHPAGFVGIFTQTTCGHEVYLRPRGFLIQQAEFGLNSVSQMFLSAKSLAAEDLCSVGIGRPWVPIAVAIR